MSFPFFNICEFNKNTVFLPRALTGHCTGHRPGTDRALTGQRRSKISKENACRNDANLIHRLGPIRTPQPQNDNALTVDRQKYRSDSSLNLIHTFNAPPPPLFNVGELLIYLQNLTPTLKRGGGGAR